jgi:hypothetical protein
MTTASSTTNAGVLVLPPKTRVGGVDLSLAQGTALTQEALSHPGAIKDGVTLVPAPADDDMLFLNSDDDDDDNEAPPGTGFSVVPVSNPHTTYTDSTKRHLNISISPATTAKIAGADTEIAIPVICAQPLPVDYVQLQPQPQSPPPALMQGAPAALMVQPQAQAASQSLIDFYKCIRGSVLDYKRASLQYFESMIHPTLGVAGPVEAVAVCYIKALAVEATDSALHRLDMLIASPEAVGLTINFGDGGENREWVGHAKQLIENDLFSKGLSGLTFRKRPLVKVLAEKFYGGPIPEARCKGLPGLRECKARPGACVVKNYDPCDAIKTIDQASRCQCKLTHRCEACYGPIATTALAEAFMKGGDCTCLAVCQNCMKYYCVYSARAFDKSNASPKKFVEPQLDADGQQVAKPPPKKKLKIEEIIHTLIPGSPPPPQPQPFRC